MNNPSPPSVCFYFQVHQPYRLRDMRITDIGRGKPNYFDCEKNEEIFRKVARKCYLPANKLMKELLMSYPDFSVSYSLSGIFIEQCKKYGTDVLESFVELAKTGKAEFLAETYYHSLSSLKSIEEFCEQVSLHAEEINNIFGQTPKVFRNTELIYSNELAQIARLMGFKGILAEGADSILKGRSPNNPFAVPEFTMPKQITRIIETKRPLSKEADDITVLLKNYKLSDDVAFRFSDKSWIGFPLTAETFTDWLMEGGGRNVNLFMDYETFGEHQWEDTGIFEFLRSLPAVWKSLGISALTPSEVIEKWKEERDVFDSHSVISWADTERDLSAWQENLIQRSSLDDLYSLESAIKETGNGELIELWRLLQISDHFYYMCTKYFSDGDVHKYFNPYESPYEAYRRYSHALHDIKERLNSFRPSQCQDNL